MNYSVVNEKKNDFIRHEACPACRKVGADTDGDNLARYSDGSAYCFKCKFSEQGFSTVVSLSKPAPKSVNFIEGEYKDLQKRKISSETCRKFHYQSGDKLQIANYYNKDFQLEGQHIRYPNKDFKWIGSIQNVLLFGQHLWRDGGKMVIVTEGEVDCLSVSQYVFQNRFPVVSIPSGVQSAAKYVAANIEWLEKFEHVIFCFDNDSEGKEAAMKCSALITPAKAKIAALPLKDASDMIQAGRAKELVDCIWGAKIYRPDGIVSGNETWDLVIANDTKATCDYPFAGLNEKLRGLRLGEIVTLTAGTGIGKSQVCRELAHHLINRGENVGYICLEESVQRSMRGLLSITLNKPIHIQKIREEIPVKEIRTAWETLNKNICFYNHFGSTGSQNLMSKIKYFVRSCNCKWIVLDHINMAVSGINEGDERRLIDNIMTRLRSLVEELQFGLILVCHLKRPVNVNRGHEEGLATSMSQLRGSAGIGQLSDIVIGCERNQQSEDHPNLMTVRVLKNRFTGDVGIAAYMQYDSETTRLTEQGYDFNNDRQTTNRINRTRNDF